MRLRPRAPTWLLAALLALPLAHAAGAVPGTSACPRHELTSGDERLVVAACANRPWLLRLSTGAGHSLSLEAPAQLPAHAWRAGRRIALQWKLAAPPRQPDSAHFVAEYVSTPALLRARWEWQARGAPGPFELQLTLENTGIDDVILAGTPSLVLDWRVAAATPLRRFWVEKGADTPSAQGVHDDPLSPGDAWTGRSSPYAHPVPGFGREMIPYVLLYAAAGGRDGLYVGIESSARNRIVARRGRDGVSLLAGLNPEASLHPGSNAHRTRLAAGETRALPTVFLGAASAGPDGAGNALRRWVRAALNDPATLADPHYPWAVVNSWGSGMAIDDAGAREMVREAHDLGLELFHLDAGWFAGVGDWRDDAAKFPAGVRALSDYAHSQGLRFGLWIDWTQAGSSGAPGAMDYLRSPARDWLVTDPPPGWRHTEPYKGITMDLGVPSMQRWALAMLDGLVTSRGLDMLEHDGYLVAQGGTRSDRPALPPDPGSARLTQDAGFLMPTGSNDTDVSDHATRGYYSVYEQLRARHPALLFEVCNDGGRMVDFGTAAHGDYFSITDTYDPLSNRRAFHDTSFVLPPAMLEAYVEKWSDETLHRFRYMLRSGMMGWFSLMQLSSGWSPAQQAAAASEIAFYKAELRPLIRAADLYHVGPRPDGLHWDGIEYFDPRAREGALYAFRGSAPGDASHAYRLQGLDPARRYRLRWRDAGTEAVATGAQLSGEGLAIDLPEPESSEIVRISELP